MQIAGLQLIWRGDHVDINQHSKATDAPFDILRRTGEAPSPPPSLLPPMRTYA